MDITVIIAALKARCPSFGDFPNRRFAGAAEYARLEEGAHLPLPAGYVVPMDDEAGEQQSSNGYRQQVRDKFAVIVVFSNSVDERGQASISSVHLIRRELFAALLGWQPDAEHDRIEYEGGQLLDVDRGRLYYQYEFAAVLNLGEEDTYQHAYNQALPAFTTMGIDVDTLDPYDPNLVTVGPDGRLELTAVIDVPQD